MKKSVLCSIFFSFGFSFANNSDYSLKFPLESSSGGNLPNGSIVMLSQSSNYSYDCTFRATNSLGAVMPIAVVGKCENGVFTGKVGPTSVNNGVCDKNRNVSFLVGPVEAPTQNCPE